MTMELREYFETEAAGYLEALEQEARALASEAGSLERLQRPARSLAGLARLAGDSHVQRAAGVIARALRSPVEPPEAVTVLADRVLSSIPGLRSLLDREIPEENAEQLVVDVVGEWEDPGTGGMESATIPRETDFLAFVASEATGIADTTERAIAAFADQPANREWIGAILRRQRVLLGSARLDEVPIVPEALRAVEDLAELIVRLDVPVKSEWLDVFRTSLDVLRNSAAMLQAGDEPEPTPALSRLRTLHNELTDRYGDRVPAGPSPSAGVAPSGSPSAVIDPAGTAVERAAALRARIERDLDRDSDARRALDDLWALLVNALH